MTDNPRPSKKPKPGKDSGLDDLRALIRPRTTAYIGVLSNTQLPIPAAWTDPIAVPIPIAVAVPIAPPVTAGVQHTENQRRLLALLGEMEDECRLYAETHNDHKLLQLTLQAAKRVSDLADAVDEGDRNNEIALGRARFFWLNAGELLEKHTTASAGFFGRLRSAPTTQTAYAQQLLGTLPGVLEALLRVQPHDEPNPQFEAHWATAIGALTAEFETVVRWTRNQ